MKVGTSKGGAGSRKPEGSHHMRRIREEEPPKLREIAACPDCRASYRAGRWTWKKAPIGSYEHRCPACARIRANYPAGILEVSGAFARAHDREILDLLRNVEESERREHPLKRIMHVEHGDAGFRVTVTDAKLAATFGRRLSSAFEGELRHPPTTRERDLQRVAWHRD